jgi:hypothetical protein
MFGMVITAFAGGLRGAKDNASPRYHNVRDNPTCNQGFI